MRYITIVALLSGTLCSPAMAQDPHAGHTPPKPSPEANEVADELAPASDLVVGNALPPPVVLDNAADRIYDAASMERARNVLADEHGGERISKVMTNIFEYAEADEGGGYRWDLEAWYGGDTHRLVIKTEGEELPGERPDNAEIQALYSRPIGRYTDFQAGVRYDFEPDGHTYAAVAVESLLPYWFEVEAAFYLSDRGDAFGRLEGTYDLRLTQRLILQPRIELQLAAQDVPEADIGSGISSGELGLRLRYDIRREFAPYVGVNFEKSFGRTADFARAAGEDPQDTSFVVGLRAWF
jgi:copper resistance protein B